MAFEKSFDDLLNGILTDYRNQFPDIDISQGSLVFIRSACLASALWGLYKYQEYISRQIFPDTADTGNLEHHAWTYGISRVSGEDDSELLMRVLNRIRKPPAGGNKNDYEQWALSVDTVKAAYCYPLANGDGTVDVVILADESTGSEIPTQTLLNEVAAYIDTVRPVTHSQVSVVAPVIDTQAVTMTVTGTNVNTASIAADITALLSGMAPDQALYRAQLSAAAINNGAMNVTITIPAADVSPIAHHMIRPGVISVT